ncbi:unnamed protein product [Chondrus crispus]|uniref:DNA mismatch repair proteins mutS family domain-containing protein n=1 Tax=Chondrus crispus TaxID=2769 RepID=R7QRI0_CHOCR|nr:unnamed protein product [Chondrus crispus]CDF39965.1 unnamed protein product [Chondrus crispus]|eukprot:XP_005710259.1 unnamed protein product [Chondrus crispus]
MSKPRRDARRKLGALDSQGRVIGKDENNWCERNSWTVDIRDSQKRKPNHPNYDKTTLFVPPEMLREKTKGSKKGPLTPFQRQFWAIKSANYDVIIFFKKGKFYELYDVDADIGHQELGLNFTRGGRVDMRCCGVPEQSFDKHCARLIDLGYKVGRVEQTETANAAEKRKNSGAGNQSTVCHRSLVRILTKATVTDEGLLRDHRARYVLSILEELNDSTPSRKIGVCYVDVASGNISIGEFMDDFRLAQTERLVTFLRPHEIITNLSAASQRLAGILKWAANSNEAEIIETSTRRGFSSMTSSWLSTYFTSQKSQCELKRVRKHLDDHALCKEVFGAMASHLKSLIIDKETLSLGNYHLFSTTFSPNGDSKYLRIDAPTMQNLEILSSCNDGSERGTLLSFVDRARTPAGRRLLRKWIAEPLVSSTDINDRLDAIGDIHILEDSSEEAALMEVLKHLKTKKDLERALPKGFVAVLRGLQDCLEAVDTLREVMDKLSPKSKRLRWLYSPGCGVSKGARDKLNYFLGEAFDLRAAEVAGEILPNRGAVPLYDECRDVLKSAESELSSQLIKWRQKLGDNSIKFYHRGKEPFQLEVKLTTLKGKTPNEFEVVSEAKAVKRFYTSEIRRLIRKHIEASEAHEIASASVVRDMIGQFDAEYDIWAAITRVSAELDALIGLAATSRGQGNGPMCRPTILPKCHLQAEFHAVGLRHPTLAAQSDSFVPNDVYLGGEQKPDVMVLTGPNAGGKSTLARQIAIGAILAQMGCYVPAESLRIRPFEEIFVRMGASDDLARGRSTFMVEMEEVGHILNNATSRSLIIADEVGRGTSTHDGYAVAYASLKHIVNMNKSLTVFSTHYSHLGENIVSLAALYEMAAVINEKTKEITFLYKLRNGSSGDSRGIYCARVAGISEAIASNAERASMLFYHSLASRLTSTNFQKISKALEGDDKKATEVLQS